MYIIFALKIWFRTTKFMLFQHRFGRKLGSFCWRSMVLLHFFVLKISFILTKLRFFNINLALKLNHIDNILGFIAYFCVLNPIMFDQTNDFVTYLGPQIWFKLMTFCGRLTFFLCSKSELFRQKSWFFNFLIFESLIHFDCVLWFSCKI